MLPPSLLEQFLTGQVFAFIVIFSRVGSMVMIMPGIGESYIAARIRLSFALMFSLLLMPAFAESIPEPPGAFLLMALLLMSEILIGIFFGFFTRLLVNTLHIAGTIIAYQSSLALAAFFDATQNAQSTVIGNFLTISAVVLFFTMNMHHLMLIGIADSYSLFEPGNLPVVEDMAYYLMRTAGNIFRIAVQLSAGHVIFALVFYLGSGILARLMPTMQVFFVLMPTQILMGFFILLAMLNMIMLTYSEFVQTAVNNFINPL